MGEVHVEVGDGAGGGVVQNPVDAVGLEVPLADLERQGEPVEAPAAAPLQGFEDRRRGRVGLEAEVERGGLRPAVRPERAPPGGDRARANGGFEREEAEDVQPQRLRQRRNTVLLRRSRAWMRSLPSLARPPPLRAATGVQLRRRRHSQPSVGVRLRHLFSGRR